MNNLNKISKAICIKACLILTCLMIGPFAHAISKNCCRGVHGGPTAKTTRDGFIVCKDKSVSTCKNKTTTSLIKTKKNQTLPASSTTLIKKNTNVTPTSGTQTKPFHWLFKKSATSPAGTTKTTLIGGKSGGCCSHHGGVAKCNTSTGYYVCKDGAQSKTCTCSN